MEFNQIWQDLRGDLQNFIKTKVNDPIEAEDILQEVGIKLLDNLNRKTGINNFKTWMYQVTRNTIADYYRKKNKINLSSDLKEDYEISNNCVCDLSGFLIQNYLPKEYGRPLFLSDIEGIPQNEISQILDLSLSATKSRIQRGRKKLKEVILNWANISYNNRGQVTNIQLKDSTQLPTELLLEIEKLKLIL